MNHKILVVDDESDVREVISQYFDRRGYDVDTASNGQEALSRILVERPELILLDIRMPEMDGIECLRRIKKLDKEMTVIMVTCVDEIDTAKKALRLGATDYITKPLGFSALETAISTYLFLKSVN
ncbi:MAG: response regulator [Candidatus Omnitrophica bacterium]|nr:response regulator [Candidatus Omnitrophota bacterium]